MNITRNGKIARLPKAVREELNRRLANGETGKDLVSWLNDLLEVQTIIAVEFEGRPVREQNLSEWKQGGYVDWCQQQETLDMLQALSDQTDELKQTSSEPLTEKLGLWLAARYVVAARELAKTTDDAEKYKMLREMCSDVVALRRGDQFAERLRIERERLQFERERDRKKTEEEFREWAMRPENREQVCAGFSTHAEKLEILGQAMFQDHWKPKTAEEKN